jgi:hypothetical protein
MKSVIITKKPEGAVRVRWKGIIYNVDESMDEETCSTKLNDNTRKGKKLA